MSPYLATLYLAGGFLFLTFGANWLVSGGASIAMRMGISGTVVGLTVISYGTSLPEFTVSMTSAFSGSSELAFGNVLGSNIANIGLILGFTALLNPLKVNSRLFSRDLPFLLVATLLMILASSNGYIGRIEGGILFLLGASYTIYLIYSSQKDDDEGDDNQKTSMAKNWGLILLGMVLLMAGGKLSVDGAVSLAQLWGMSDRVIAITVVSVGTSLPELAATITASRKNKMDMALGNIIGSNIFNILFVLGVTALIHPLSITFNTDTYRDLGVMAFMVAILWPIMKSRKTIVRLEGAMLLTGYSGYLIWLVIG
jgi:cation:H+ antiporter